MRPAPRAVSGLVFNLQKYCLHDGPGIRTTVFLKGCPLCCSWCHNPEGIQPQPEIVRVETRCLVCGECRAACPLPVARVGEGPLPTRLPDCLQCGACLDACPSGARERVGRRLTVPEVMREVLQDRIFYDDSGGGVTFSGGEPLAQPRFLLALLEACRAASVSAALDTTGFGPTDTLLAAARLCQLVLYDLKAFDDTLHHRLTGVSNRTILSNLEALDALGIPLWLRLPIVPGHNDHLDDWQAAAGFLRRLRSLQRVCLLPFHRTGTHKFLRLGLPRTLEAIPTPTPELLEAVRSRFTAFGLPTQIGG